MSTNLPEQPEAPDYAAANQEGIYSDIETLPDRRKIEQAAALGQAVTYIDPRTGQEVTADFTGLGNINMAKQAAELATSTNADIQRQQLQLREELGVRNASQTAREIEAADPLAYATRQQLTGQIKDALGTPTTTIGPNQGLMDAVSKLTTAAGGAPSADGTLSELDRLKQTLNSNSGASANKLTDIYEQATRLPGQVSDESTAMLGQQLNRAMSDYVNLGGKLDENTQRNLLNQVRATQVSKGNYLGDAATVVETQNVGQAMENREAQRLQTLMDLQGKYYNQNSALRQESTANEQAKLQAQAGLQNSEYSQNQGSASALAQLAQQYFGTQQQDYTTKVNAAGQALQAASAGSAEERAARNETFGREQQKLSNASSFVLGQPITNQFGSLGAAQQGAVAYQPINYSGGTGLNANAGNQAAQFSQQSYGQQANMWTTAANIAQQDNAGMMSMVSGMAGAAAGAMI